MHKKLFSMVVCIPLFFLAACSSDGQVQNEKGSAPVTENSAVKKSDDVDKTFVTTGYIVKKDEEAILVIPKITKDEITGKNEEELEKLSKEKYEGKGVSFKFDNMNEIDKDTISALQVGQKVTIKHDMHGLSAPAYGGNVLELKIVKE
ncbi:YobA family protein (plasmid) [Bacillus badius]|uniref:DUF3221 domain-containing protein n=1 Tax=Bacillus badius TaxID=1455 RepID=UPI001CBB63A4|nr:DUF3221 domain-containing protein [Bacillus badius]UAT32901.1 YobA family protein [Bacillus badius]